MKMTFKHDFAISFAGEVRETAEKLANLLMEKKVRVYYDRYFEGEMLGKNLSNYFQHKFGEDAKYVIILISKEYPLKNWTNLEISIARDEAKKRKEEFILPIRLDDTKILGIHDDICHIDLREKSIEEAVDLLIEKLNIEEIEEKIEDRVDDLDEKYIKEIAKDLFSKVNKVNLSEILLEYYDFLIKINDKDEIKWVEAELSGDIYEAGKDNTEYFEYRGIRGYLSPVKITSFGLSTLDMVIADPKFAMAEFNYIPSISIFELERYTNDLDKIGILTLSEEVVKLLKLDTINISKVYFYFKPSDIIHIISNMKQKISRFLLKIMRN
ncbi:MAG: TIR domain-containing protein [Promethearchaeota archaeon]